MVHSEWRWVYGSQKFINNQTVGFGFPHHGGRYRPGKKPFSSSVCSSGTCMENFLSGGETLSPPGGAGSKDPSKST